MEFVHVETALSLKNRINYSAAVIKLSSHALISLIHGLKGKNFGFDSTLILSNKIRTFCNNLKISDFFIFVDSGGYSIIKGDVPIIKSHLFADCYNRFFEFEYDSFDYIFSLDIPIWNIVNLDLPKTGSVDIDKVLLTTSNLYSHNHYSITNSLEVIKRNPELSKKWFFVWHFKYFSQFNTWLKLFSELDIKNVTSNYAIGGQVGIREAVLEDSGNSLNFSPFSAMAFKCFSEYLDSNLTIRPFRLHVLGIYQIIDRFQLILIEKLFNNFLKRNGKPLSQLTHDTINYSLSGMYDSRKLKPYDFESGKLKNYKNIFEFPEDKIKQIYFTEETYNGFCKERERLRSNENFENISYILPLNIYSNLCIDNYLNYLVEKIKFESLIYEANDTIELTYFISDLFKKIENENCFIFDDFFLENLENNLFFLFNLWKALIGNEKEKITDYVEHSIKLLRLKDPFS